MDSPSNLIEHGSHGLVVAGSTGEAPTLTDAEQISLLSAVVGEIGVEATVICGTGTNDTRHSCELTKAAAAAGADAALVVAPYYNKPNKAGLRAHFEAVAEAAPGAAAGALQHPLAGGDQHGARASSRARLDRQHGRGQAGQRRRARPDRGPGSPGRQR